MNDAPREGRLWWAAFAVTAISACVSLGFAIEALVRLGTDDSSAMYAASRSVALVVAVAAVAVVRSRRALIVVALAMIVVQALDAVVGVTIGDLVKSVGPTFTAVLNLVVLVPVVRSVRAEASA
ncbi:hypothetical protein ACPPVS_14405 [Cellulomonas sp. McL0617]|uniref:hypothetical protein n=1 Tax=Cellulomonas sp. McL0617 TaxID=3415675 RepID=UPI003CEEAAAC